MLALVGKVKLFLKEEANCFQASVLPKADIGDRFDGERQKFANLTKSKAPNNNLFLFTSVAQV